MLRRLLLLASLLALLLGSVALAAPARTPLDSWTQSSGPRSFDCRVQALDEHPEEDHRDVEPTTAPRGGAPSVATAATAEAWWATVDVLRDDGVRPPDVPPPRALA